MLLQRSADGTQTDSMPDSETSPSRLTRLAAWVGAWQPFTGSGVASFARATLSRLLFFQVGFAVLGGLAAVLAVRLAWIPTVEDALLHLPDQAAQVRSGRLQWPGTNSVLLGERPQLAIGVMPVGGATLGQGSDLQFDFRPDRFRLRGLLGFLDLPYPPDFDLPLTRTGGRAAWDAWRVPILVSLSLITTTTQLAVWWLVAALAALPVWGIAAIAKRSPGIGGAWKLCSAGLLPASVLFFSSLLLYSARAIPPTGLGVGTTVAAVAGGLWIAWAIARLPKAGRPEASADPFGGGVTAKPGSKVRKGKKNPFGTDRGPD